MALPEIKIYNKTYNVLGTLPYGILIVGFLQSGNQQRWCDIQLIKDGEPIGLRPTTAHQLIKASNRQNYVILGEDISPAYCMTIQEAIMALAGRIDDDVLTGHQRLGLLSSIEASKDGQGIFVDETEPQ